MKWSELNSDRTMWTIPASRAKNGIQHQVPIVPWVRSILAELPRFAGSDLVFTTAERQRFDNYSRCKRALDAKIAEMNSGTPIAAWTLHDCRRSVASGMAKLGVALPVIEKILNHVSGPSFGGVQGIYQRHTFSDEMRAALEAWAQHLLTLDLVESPCCYRQAAAIARHGLTGHAQVDVFRKGGGRRGVVRGPVRACAREAYRFACRGFLHERQLDETGRPQHPSRLVG